MKELAKIRDVSNQYGVSARTLRYYEDKGLLESIRTDDVSYRMYDEAALHRLEQILILRKLNISVKDIKRIFEDASSSVVLDVLTKKVDAIDEEVLLLSELRDIVLDFIHEIEHVSFTNEADVKQLYLKAKEVEQQIVNVDDKKKPLNMDRFVEITEKLDNKIPDVMVIRVPAFRALTSGTHTWQEIFQEGGYMFQLWIHYTSFRPILFDCLDFTLVKSNNEGEMICAIKDDADENSMKPLEVIDFPGGLYAMAVTKDEDDESISKVQDKIIKWLEGTNFILDESRSFMFNMPYLDEDNTYQQDIEKGLGYRQQQRYIPIKLK